MLKQLCKLMVLLVFLSCESEVTIEGFATALPSLGDGSSFSGRELDEGSSGFSLDINDQNTLSDRDSGGATITYTCSYDTNVDGSVPAGSNCNSLDGFNLNSSTGIITWNPGYEVYDEGDNGRYEFKIIATSTNGSSEIVFVIAINDVMSAPPGVTLSEEWVKVPADAGGMGLPSFWVMKYEAKAWNDADVDGEIDAGEVHATGIMPAIATHKPVSVADNSPWRRIHMHNAASECESLGANYGLITNEEWMAISRDIENQAANWTGNAIGSGCLFRGNTGEVTTGDGNTLGDSCGYVGAMPESGNGRDIRAKHVLSNGNEIYDLSGNLWEWVEWDDPTSPIAGYQFGPACNNMGVEQLPTVTGSNCGAVLVDADYNTDNGSYDINQGVGIFYSNGSGMGGTIARGGSWVADTDAGIFFVQYGEKSASVYMDGGFRCVYRP